MSIRQEPQFFLNRSTNVITLQGLREKTTGQYPTDAVVTCTALDGLGAPIAGVIDVPMPYVATTVGASSLYRGVVDSAVNLAGMAKARIRIVRAGAEREINVPAVAKDG